MDLFTGIDWTACRILNVVPVHAAASEILEKNTASTQFYQFGVKFHGYTDIYYNHCHLVFNTGSILYLPKEKSKSIPYDKIIRQDGEGVCIFFDSLHPLAEKPAVFSPSEQTLPLEQFSRLLHTWQ